MKNVDKQYVIEKAKAQSQEDLIGRLLLNLVHLQNSSNQGLNALDQKQEARHGELLKTNNLQRRAIAQVLSEIKNAVEGKEIDFSDVIGVLSHIASSNSALYEVLKRGSREYPEMRKQLERIAKLTSDNKPEKANFDKIIQSQEKSYQGLGKLVVALTEEVKRKKLPETMRLSGPVEIEKPKWWKPFELSWEPMKELFEKLKSHTFSVKVTNTQEKEDPLDIEKLAKKIGAEVERAIKKIPRSGGMGNPFTFMPGGAVKVYTENGGGAEGGSLEETQLQVLDAIQNITVPAPEGGATETTLASVLSQLQAVNANTDGLETLLIAISGYVDALESNTSGLATNATLVQVRDYLDTVETKLQTLIDQTDTLEANTDQVETLLTSIRDYLDTVETVLGTINTTIQDSQPRDISKAITAMTISLNASGNVKVPSGGKKLRIYSVQFSLSADMTDVSFRFTSGGTDFAKFLVPKAGGYYGLNMNHRYFDGGIDQALYCVITGTGTVQINVNYVEI